MKIDNTYYNPLEEGKVYHVYNHGINKDDLFYNEDNYRFFLTKMQLYICPIADIFSYSLLPNHFHLMIRVKSKDAIQLYYAEEHTKKGIPFRISGKETNNQTQKVNGENTDSPQFVHYFVSEQFRRLFVSYSKALNKQRSRRGGLFCKAFKRKCVEAPQYFTWLVFYIHANAEKHGLVKDFMTYPYSSYFSIMDDAANWLLKDVILEWFGGKDKYKAFHETNKPFLDKTKSSLEDD